VAEGLITVAVCEAGPCTYHACSLPEGQVSHGHSCTGWCCALKSEIVAASCKLEDKHFCCIYALVQEVRS
jgi:hypothetical protein